MTDAEREEALAKLVQRTTKLSHDEVALLHAVWRIIVRAHFRLRPVLEALRAPPPDDEEAELQAFLDRLDAKLSSPSWDAADPVVLDDADVASALPTPPTPAAPAPAKVEEPAAPPPPEAPRPGRPPAFLAATAMSAKAGEAPRAAKVPEVRVVAASQEHAQAVPVRESDPAQGARPGPPALTLDQYVAYRMELWLWPQRGFEVHRRYTVENEAAYWELVRGWEGRLAASPELRAEAEALQAGYLERVRAM
jgi:hypothetical protein